jgi:hypothetical protein
MEFKGVAAVPTLSMKVLVPARLFSCSPLRHGIPAARACLIIKREFNYLDDMARGASPLAQLVLRIHTDKMPNPIATSTKNACDLYC